MFKGYPRPLPIRALLFLVKTFVNMRCKITLLARRKARSKMVYSMLYHFLAPTQYFLKKENTKMQVCPIYDRNTFIQLN